VLTDNDDKTKVTVFGGDVFLDGHVADYLSKSWYQVQIFDKYEFPWTRPSIRKL
jgi:hypothetical protein